MKAVLWIVVLGAVGFGIYWFIIRPRREAGAVERRMTAATPEEQAIAMGSIRSAIGMLRKAPIAVN